MNINSFKLERRIQCHRICTCGSSYQANWISKKCFSYVRSTKNNKNWWTKLHKLLLRFTHVFGAFNWVSSATSEFLNIVVTCHAISMWSGTSGPDPLRHCGNCLWLDGQTFYVKLLRQIDEGRNGDANTISIRIGHNHFKLNKLDHHETDIFRLRVYCASSRLNRNSCSLSTSIRYSNSSEKMWFYLNFFLFVVLRFAQTFTCYHSPVSNHTVSNIEILFSFLSKLKSIFFGVCRRISYGLFSSQTI